MLKLKKVLRDAFVLFVAAFFVAAPLLSDSQVWAQSTECGQQLDGKQTYCSIGYHSDPKVNLSCPLFSTCYQGNAILKSECAWTSASQSPTQNPTFCWSFENNDPSIDPIETLKGSKVNLTCAHEGSFECGGILSQGGLQGGLRAALEQWITNDSVGGYQITSDKNNHYYTCITMNYRQEEIKSFVAAQMLRECGINLASAVGLSAFSISTGGAGAAVASSFAGSAVAVTVSAAGVVGSTGMGIKQCIDRYNSNGSRKLTWKGVSYFPKGEVACTATTDIEITLNEGAKSNTKSLTAVSQASLCNQVPDPKQRTMCEQCASSNGGDTMNPKAIWTSLGCIPTTAESIVGQLVKVALGIAGTAALLMILAGAFMLSTSQGETKRVGEAKELITSAVVGILFIIFSITILKFIGISIFKLPGFGS